MSLNILNRKKRSEKLYAFNIDSTKATSKGSQMLNFTKNNRGFYEELLNYDDNIKKSLNELKKQKQTGIKELIYTNKRVPNKWKNKITFYEDLYSTMNKDEKFVSYLGKISTIDTNDNYTFLSEPETTKTSTDFNSKGIQTAGKLLLNSTLVKEENPGNFASMNRRSLYGLRGNLIGNNKIFNQAEITNILEDYKVNYPIEIPKELKLGETQKNQQELTEGNKNSSNLLPTIKQTKKDVYGKKGMNKSQVFKSTIYTNLIPANGKIENLESEKKVKKHKLSESLQPNSEHNFLHLDNKFFNILPVHDKVIEQKLIDIDYYGPYFSHCPPCKNKNLNWYNNMEHSQCLKLLKYLKGYRKSKLLKYDNNSNKQK